jgi:CheY-like chemotaxis protein
MADILIIEDNSDDLQTIRTILEKHKHKVMSAINGKNAVELIDKDNHFDVILIDVLLPDVSGYKLLEIIREKLGKTVKCIYVTIVPKKEIDNNKADGFVQKPFLPNELKEEVEKCLIA